MSFQFIELQQFGYNATTVGFLGTVFFTLVQMWGLSDQAKKIRREQSGASIPMLLLSFFGGEQLAFLVFGLQTQRLAAVINGLLGFWYIRTYIAAAHYPDSGGGRWWQYALLFGLAPCIGWSASYRDALMMALIVIATSTLLQTPLNISRNKDVGTVDIRWLLTLTASMLFWTIYSYETRFWGLLACNVFGLAGMVWAFKVWLQYRKRPKKLVLV